MYGSNSFNRTAKWNVTHEQQCDHSGEVPHADRRYGG
jgi:hypothetical protein